MKIIIQFSLLILLLGGCKKEKITTYSVYIKNSTAVSIKIYPSINGYTDYGNIIELAIGENKEIASGEDKGIVSHGGFDSKYFSGADYLLVVFGDKDSVQHLIYLNDSLINKYIKYDNARNLLNMTSYSYKFNDKNKSKRNALYEYTFTEEDYNFAKE